MWIRYLWSHWPSSHTKASCLLRAWVAGRADGAGGACRWSPPAGQLHHEAGCRSSKRAGSCGGCRAALLRAAHRPCSALQPAPHTSPYQQQQPPSTPAAPSAAAAHLALVHLHKAGVPNVQLRPKRLHVAHASCAHGASDRRGWAWRRCHVGACCRLAADRATGGRCCPSQPLARPPCATSHLRQQSPHLSRLRSSAAAA